MEIILIYGIVFQANIDLLAPKKKKKKTRKIILDWRRTGLIQQEAGVRNRQDIRDRVGKMPKANNGKMIVKKVWKAGSAMKISYIMAR